MSRALSLTLTPKDSINAGLVLETYTYAYSPEIEYATMRETVFLGLNAGPFDATSRLTPDEARVLANQLLQVADEADEHRARRESLEEIEEQLRDEDFDSSVVRFAHPDIVYCAPGQLSETAKAHPGKLIIAERDEVPA
jgi:hypothetical protein